MRLRLAAASIAMLALAALPGAAPAAAPGGGTKITAGGSDFGTMIWAPGRQAVYMFDKDGRNKSRCYGRCAKAWPPVLANGKARAGRGVDPELLGTARRRNGDRQVTYAGNPLYTYAHESARQVLCHDVNLNGGYWWVLGPDGDPLP